MNDNYYIYVNDYGTIKHFCNGKLHKTDGPAIEESNGTKAYFINGKLHREDGPAIEYFNGLKKYYLCGKEYSYEEWLKIKNLVVFL